MRFLTSKILFKPKPSSPSSACALFEWPHTVTSTKNSVYKQNAKFGLPHGRNTLPITINLLIFAVLNIRRSWLNVCNELNLIQYENLMRNMKNPYISFRSNINGHLVHLLHFTHYHPLPPHSLTQQAPTTEIQNTMGGLRLAHLCAGGYSCCCYPLYIIFEYVCVYVYRCAGHIRYCNTCRSFFV